MPCLSLSLFSPLSIPDLKNNSFCIQQQATQHPSILSPTSKQTAAQRTTGYILCTYGTPSRSVCCEIPSTSLPWKAEQPLLAQDSQAGGEKNTLATLCTQMMLSMAADGSLLLSAHFLALRAVGPRISAAAAA